MLIEKKIHLQDNEEIMQLVRPSWISFFWSYLLGAVVFFIPAYFLFWFLQFGLWGQIGFGVLLFLGLVIFLRALYLTKSNTLVITSERVVDINRSSLLKENVYTLNLANIRDVSVEKQGFKSLLGLGTLIIESRGDSFVLDITNISKATKWQSYILNLVKEHRSSLKVSDEARIYKNFVKIIKDLDNDKLDRVIDLINEEIEAREEEDGLAEED